MARKHRSRTRRPIASPRRPLEAERAAEREAAPPRDRGPRTARAAVRTGSTRAIGEPSAALERAAAWERGFVVKDFRRMGIVVAVMLALLALSGIGVSALLR